MGFLPVNTKETRVGVNPATPTNKPTNFRDVAQPGSAHAWGAWGRRFKSCHPDFYCF